MPERAGGGRAARPPRRGDRRPRALRRPRRSAASASRTSSSATRSTRASPRRVACACTERCLDALEAAHGDAPGPHFAELAHHAIAASDFERGSATRRGRPGARAARLRGGRAPVRDGARRARPRRETGAASFSSGSERPRPRPGTRPRRSRIPRRGRRRSPPRLARASSPGQRPGTAAGHVGARLARPARAAARGGARGAAGEEVELRAALLARLAGALRDEHSRDRRDPLSQEAVELARSTGNPPPWPTRSTAGRGAIAPDTIAELLAFGRELRHVAEQLGDANGSPSATCSGRARDDGRPAGGELDLATEAAIADELRQPELLWEVDSARAMLALATGRLDEAEELRTGVRARRARAARDGDPCRPAPVARAAATSGAALEALEGVRDLAASSDAPVFRGVARPLTRGSDTREARRRPGGSGADDARPALRPGVALRDEPSRGDGGAPRRCASARRSTGAAPVGGAAKPRPPGGFRGSVSRDLGVLARCSAAATRAHFEAALATNEQTGARPWLARTRTDYARLLAPATVPAIASALPGAGGCGGRRGADLPPLCRCLTAPAQPWRIGSHRAIHSQGVIVTRRLSHLRSTAALALAIAAVAAPAAVADTSARRPAQPRRPRRGAARRPGRPAQPRRPRRGAPRRQGRPGQPATRATTAAASPRRSSSRSPRSPPATASTGPRAGIGAAGLALLLLVGGAAATTFRTRRAPVRAH